jgi:transposase, IS6 family
VRNALSDRHLEQLTRQRGVILDHTTVLRRVQRYAPEPDTCCPRYGRATKDSSRVDETSMKINKL